MNIAVENCLTLLERDISHSSSERIIFKDAAHIACFVLQRISKVLIDLNLNTDISERNVEIFNKMTSSQDIMNQSIRGGKSRKYSHDESQNTVEKNIL